MDKPRIMRLSPEAEVRLIVRAQRNDKRAIAELLSLCEPLMRKTAGKWTIAGHDDDDKYSICLLAFDRAVKGFDATRGSSRLSTSLTYSLLNLFDHAKRHCEGSTDNSKEQKKGLVQAVQFSQLGDEDRDAFDTKDENAADPSAMKENGLIRLISNLPSRVDRRIFFYHARDGLSFDEIGQILERSGQWVRTHYEDAVKWLKSRQTLDGSHSRRNIAIPETPTFRLDENGNPVIVKRGRWRNSSRWRQGRKTLGPYFHSPFTADDLYQKYIVEMKSVNVIHAEALLLMTGDKAAISIGTVRNWLLRAGVTIRSRELARRLMHETGRYKGTTVNASRKLAMLRADGIIPVNAVGNLLPETEAVRKERALAAAKKAKETGAWLRAQRKTLNCEWCGVSVTRRASDFKGTHVYCSASCKSKHYWSERRNATT